MKTLFTSAALISLLCGTMAFAQTKQLPGGAPKSRSATTATTLTKSPSELEIERAAKTAFDSLPHDCSVPDQPTGTDLRLLAPFAPNEGVLEAWCKIQTFKSSSPIKVWLVTDEHTTQLIKSSFIPDGTVQSKRNMFAFDLITNIHRNGGAYFGRATRTVGSYGVPEGAPEAPYQVYTGNLLMELSDVEMMGLKFTLSVTFEPNMGLIPKHFSNAADYLHIPMSSSNNTTKSVGFPWVLSMVSLFSTDQRIAVASPEIKNMIVQKYAKWVESKDEIDPQDKRHLSTQIVDRSIRIGIHEGIDSETKAKYLQINYLPRSNGPLDAITPGKSEFRTFVKSATDRYKQSVLDQMKAKGTKNPF